MKAIFSEKYLDKKDEILQILVAFSQKGKTIKEGGRNTLKVFDLDAVQINIKAFKVPNLLNKIVYRFLRKSKAERSFSYANLLLQKGIGTPKPIAYIEEKNTFSFGKSYYISEHLDADFTYRELIRDENFPEREKILKEFTAFTYKLHQNNILFKDHSPGNTLIKKNGAQYEFYLVDLNRMNFKELSFEERIKNFSRLTPKKEMIAIMSEAYASLSPWGYDEIFEKMWAETQDFQEHFFRKKRLKKKLLFRKD